VLYSLGLLVGCQIANSINKNVGAVFVKKPCGIDTFSQETDIIDVNGQVYRPDRVVVEDGKVLVIDYKFGRHHSKYERQMKTYSEIFHRMGYAEVTAILWYVQTGEYKVI
jgi:hypothetical protein